MVYFSPDRPIIKSSEDLLGRADFASAVAGAIEAWKQKDSLVIGLYGPWGSGKSSVKNLILERLRESPDNSPEIVEFNPWQLASQEQIVAEFFREIGLALDRVTGGKKGCTYWSRARETPPASTSVWK